MQEEIAQPSQDYPCRADSHCPSRCKVDSRSVSRSLVDESNLHSTHICPRFTRALLTDNIYNNWFVSKVSFWLRPDVQDFLLHVNRTHVIYTERWGDLLWQSAALQLFMDQSKLWMFKDFAYEHASFSTVPFPANPTWKLARLQGLNRTCLAYGGIALASQGGAHSSSSSSKDSSQDEAHARLRTLASTPLCRHYRDGRYVMRPCVVHDGAAYVKGGGPRPVTSYLLGSVSTVQAGCGRPPSPLWCNASAGATLCNTIEDKSDVDAMFPCSTQCLQGLKGRRPSPVV